MTATLFRRALLSAGALSLATLATAGHLADGLVTRAQAEPMAAQKPLRTQALTIVGQDGKRHAFSVELAETPHEQEVGLMYRTSVAPDGGMLFVWPQTMKSQMWMENTLVPLDMVFISADGTIDSIAENTVPKSLAIVASADPVAATLELQGGLTAKLGIVVGDKVISKALPAR